MAKPLIYNNRHFIVPQQIYRSTTEIRVNTPDPLPGITNGDWIVGTLVPKSGEGDLEIVHIVDVQGDTLTIERGKEDTSPQEFLPGAVLELRVTAGLLTSAVESSYLMERLADPTDPENGAGMIGLRRPWSGAIATTQAELNNKIAISPEDFGARGDGIADDTAAWKDALNALDIGGVLVCPFGSTYHVTDELQAPPYSTINLNGSIINFDIDGMTKGFRLNDGVELFGGQIHVVGKAPFGTNATYLCPVSCGDEASTEGIENAFVHDLTISTTRAGGNGVLLYANSRNCVVRNIHYPAHPGTENIGQVVAMEWGGSKEIGTKHPHNILVENITTGDIQGVNAVVWISSGFNITVRNVYAKGAWMVVGIFAGDLSNDYTIAPEQKHLVGTGFVLDNIACDDVKSFGIRLYGIPSFAESWLPLSTTMRNINLRGNGLRSDATGIGMTACQDVDIWGANISGMANGVVTGQGCTNVKLDGGRIHHNRARAISIESPLVATRGFKVRNMRIYRNSTAAAGFSPAVYVDNAVGTEIESCTFGKSGEPEIQGDCILLDGNGAIHTFLGDNFFENIRPLAVGINNRPLFGQDYTMLTYGKNNVAQPGDTLLAGDPLIELMSNGTRVIHSLVNSPPVGGTWGRGDKCYISAPEPLGDVGYVCVESGSPGVWKKFGTITA